MTDDNQPTTNLERRTHLAEYRVWYSIALVWLLALAIAPVRAATAPDARSPFIATAPLGVSSAPGRSADEQRVPGTRADARATLEAALGGPAGLGLTAPDSDASRTAGQSTTGSGQSPAGAEADSTPTSQPPAGGTTAPSGEEDRSDDETAGLKPTPGGPDDSPEPTSCSTDEATGIPVFALFIDLFIVGYSAADPSGDSDDQLAAALGCSPGAG